jgi:glycosyltransferase involved in cell wall biosynthesis
VNKRVLFLHGITEIGGAERDLLLTVERLPKLGFQPTVGCPGDGPLLRELARRDIEQRNVALPPWRKFLSYPRRASSVRELRALIQDVRPALLHVNDIWWVPQALRALDGTGIPMVAHVRQEIDSWKAAQYELDRANLIFSVSRRIEESLHAIAPGRVRTLYSGLDLTQLPVSPDGSVMRATCGIPQDALLIGTVANLFPRKGYEVLLSVFPRILSACPTAHYLIVGHGDVGYERRLRAKVSLMGLSDRVHFAGFQETVYPCLAALDLYVHPALMEGFGVAILEAMAMSKAVVATTAGGVPEIVEDGRTGLLVPPGDGEALARSVMLLLQDAAGRAAKGAAGRARVVARFSVEAMLECLIAAYTDLLRNPKVFRTVSL